MRETCPTLHPTTAYPASAIAEAEAPLTAGTDRYMSAAAHYLLAASRRELAVRADDVARHQVAGIVGAGVVLLVGGGHNGGDALLAGAGLQRAGARVTALLATEHPHAAALAQAHADGVTVLARQQAVSWLHDETAPSGPLSFRLVLDGLTGIGATGVLRAEAAALIEPLLARGGRGERPFRVLAVDVPSGTGVDDGTVSGPVLAADRTVTFTCLRGTHLLPPAAQYVGELEVADLGLPVPAGAPLAQRPDDTTLARMVTVPGDADHKYTRGVVGLWAGSQTYPGAAVLTASAAARTGAGMVRLLAPRRVEDLVLASRPEVVPADGRCQALVIGPGTDPGDEERMAQLAVALERALDQDLPAVVDAGALTLVPSLLAAVTTAPGGLGERRVLTPHAGEAAALISELGVRRTRHEVEAAPAAAVRHLATLTGATVVLKGTPTLVARPAGAEPGGAGNETGPLLSLDAGPGWLATAGSGDVLAGVLGTVLADRGAQEEQGGERLDPAACAALAVCLHARAGWAASLTRQGPEADGERESTHGGPVTALDVAEALPGVLARMVAHSPAL
ncbi:bifunctional ADP-dependent NAD(P)H-hydrate dehydratase/NAD(P)H-hydrate epimerase [Actinomyces faecalis]|uniref:bifunctional ADP-dependent NAD(P)H-hydrate dehydratase/NAD(P)H-hydrate epimerase n=1 Tax=Actinomyces faecalis TaxID=2722820 RepID=UPI002E2876D2|nr:NAD(P)H-hydrate dehydratase [Actinomyces faecalis]